MIQASVFPEYFENYYARIGREPGSFFALGRVDGAVLSRFPAAARDIRLERDGPVGKLIAANPAGVDIDADALLAQYRSGVPPEQLLAMPVGPPTQIPPEHGLL